MFNVKMVFKMFVFIMKYKLLIMNYLKFDIYLVRVVLKNWKVLFEFIVVKFIVFC